MIRRGDVTRDAHADQAIGEDEDDNAAEHGAPDGALAAGKRDPAQDDGGQRLEFPADAGGRIRAVLARGIEDAADRAEQRPTAHRSQSSMRSTGMPACRAALRLAPIAVRCQP